MKPLPSVTRAGTAATIALAILATLAFVLSSATVAADGSVMYRCPGNDYNNTLSAKDAKDRGCKTIEGAPITVIQTTRPRPVPLNPGMSSGSGLPTNRVDPADQRARDSDARRILEGELRREEQRLSELKSEYAGGQPERQGNEKNYQKYLDRVADLKASIDRKEGDIAALKRELVKTPL